MSKDLIYSMSGQKQICLLHFFLFSFLYAAASPFPHDTTEKGKTTLRFRKFVFNAEMGTASEFYGRKTGEQGYVSHSFLFKGRNGNRTAVIGNSFPGTLASFDGLTVMEGWKFSPNKNWEIITDYAHTWSSPRSERISSVLNNELTASSDYDFDIIDFYLACNYYYTSITRRQRKTTKPADKTALRNINDYVLEAALSRTFEFDNIHKGKTDLCLIPEISVSYGTQNYVVAYQNEVLKDTLTSAATAMEANRGNILDYKTQLGIAYYFNKWSVEQDFSYHMPVNQLPGQSTDNFFVMNLIVEFTLQSRGKEKKHKKYKQ